jgi:hypothetical protein
MPYFDYPDNIYINPYYLDVTPDVREEMRSRAALYSSKTRSVGIKMYDSISTKNIEWPYQKVPWAKITTLFKPNENYKQIELGLAYDKEMSDENGKLILYGEKRNTPAKPLLTGVEISNEGQRGSLLKGKFTFTYFPELLQNGFDLLDLQQSLFTPGRKVHIAFGWSTYASVIRVNKLEFSGVIFGFNWSFNPNMSISAEVQIVSPSSLAIGFSGDQTVNDDSAGQDSVVGKLPDATNLVTVIDKDLRGQQEMVELGDGSIVGWLPKSQTTTKIFDYVLIKLPITGYSSYLESSAANLQAEEWTSQTPEVIIEGSDGTGGGSGDGGGTGTGDDGGSTDDTNQLAYSNQSNWLKSVINGITELTKKNAIKGAFGSDFFSSIATGDIFNTLNTSTNGGIINSLNKRSEFIPADPEIFRPGILITQNKSTAEVGNGTISAEKIRNSFPYKNNNENIDVTSPRVLLKSPGHSQQLINLKNVFMREVRSGGLNNLLINDEALTKITLNIPELDKEPLKKRWTNPTKNEPNYIGGFMILAIIREITFINDKVQGDSKIGVIENFFDDLINIKRVEELHYLKLYRLTNRSWGRDASRYSLYNESGTRNIYPKNWQGAGFDSEGIFNSAKGKEYQGVEIPFKIINELNSEDPTEYKSEEKINGWINEILKKLGRGDLSNKSDDRSGIDDNTKNLSDEEYQKKLTQYRNEFVQYKQWIELDERSDKTITIRLNFGTGVYPNFKKDLTKTVGGIDLASIEPNMYKFAEEKGNKNNRSIQGQFLKQIIDRIDEIKNSTSEWFLKPYEDAVIKEFILAKSEQLQKKLNGSPSGTGGGGTPDTIIPPQKQIENRTYWYIKLGDLVNFANNLIEQYANKTDGSKYTFPLFKMIAHGNETDYNKNIKSAYPVDVYFPDVEMGTYHSFTPFNTEPMKDMLRTFYISEAVGAETTPDEKKARISTDVINIGEILIGLDYIRKTYRNFLYENSTNVAYKNITNFFEDIIKQINVATGDIYQLSVMLFEEPERLTSGLSSAKEPATPAKDGGTNRRALLSVEDSNLSRKHTITSDEGDVVDENENGKYYRVRPYKFEANIMKPLIKNVNVVSRPSKEATFAAYIAARGEEVALTNPEVDVGKAPPMSVDVDLSFGEFKNKKEYDDQYAKNIEEKKKAEQSAVDNGFNERWSDTYRGILTKLKRLKYKPDADGTGAHWLNMAIYPIELTLTIDGINGFKFGDVIKTNLIPSHYNTRWGVVFTITKIIHKVTPSTWETTLHTAARLPLDGNPNEGISELGPTQPAAVNPNVAIKQQVK